MHLRTRSGIPANVDRSQIGGNSQAVTQAIHWYDAHEQEVAIAYEAVSAESVHGWLVGYLPKLPALVLDIGAGTGRDAAWLSNLGHEVVAVEPSGAMRHEAE